MEGSETKSQPETKSPPSKSVTNITFCCTTPNCKCNTLLYCVAAFLIFIILSGVAYLLSTRRQSTIPVKIPTPVTNPDADWKIYTNKKYGYSLTYPSNFQICDYVNNLYISEGITSLCQDSTFRSIEPYSEVEILNIKKDFIKRVGDKYEEEEKILGSKILHSIKGLNRYSNNPSTLIWFNSGVGNYSIEIYANNYNLINQILSTFRFLDLPKPSINEGESDNDWIRYTDNQVLAFQYPSISLVSVEVTSREELESRLENCNKDIGECIPHATNFLENPDLFNKQFEILTQIGSLPNCQPTKEFISNFNDFQLFTWGPTGSKSYLSGIYSLRHGCAIRYIESAGFDIDLSNYAYHLLLKHNNNIIYLTAPVFWLHLSREIDDFMAEIGWDLQKSTCNQVCQEKQSFYFTNPSLIEPQVFESALDLYDQIYPTFKFLD